MKKYDGVGKFYEGLAVVLDGKWGFINENGKEVVSCKYDYARNFINGLARVELNNKYGFIDKEDNIVIPIKYDNAYEFREEITAIKLNEKWGFIDKENKVVIPIKYDALTNFYKCKLAIAKLNDKFGLIDKENNIVIPIKYDRVLILNNFAILFLDRNLYFIDLKDSYKIYKFNNYINIGSNVLYYERYKDDYLLSLRSFIGNLNDFKEKIMHDKDNKYYKEYMEVINKLERE